MVSQHGVPTDRKTPAASTERERPTLALACEVSDENSRDRGKNGAGSTAQDLESKTPRAEWTPLSAEKFVPAPDTQNRLPASPTISSGAGGILKDSLRREGHQLLQELYLTDEPLDGSKVARLISLLPRVTGVVIMLSDGAALGGGICGGISEALLSVTPAFVKHLTDFSKAIQGGSVRFVTFAGHACQLSLTMGGDVAILAGHQGKNLPPGLRERLVATADALNMIYSLPS
jgi:hypothetical protein